MTHVGKIGITDVWLDEIAECESIIRGDYLRPRNLVLQRAMLDVYKYWWRK